MGPEAAMVESPHDDRGDGPDGPHGGLGAVGVRLEWIKCKRTGHSYAPLDGYAMECPFCAVPKDPPLGIRGGGWTGPRGGGQAPHGTTAQYGNGCRCDECRRANTEQQRAYRGREDNPAH